MKPFHDEEHETVFGDAVVDKFDGIWVHETFNRPDFAFKTFDGDGISLEGGTHNFESDERLILEIGREINESHAAGGNESFDAKFIAKNVTCLKIGSGIVFIEMFCSNHKTTLCEKIALRPKI